MKTNDSNKGFTIIEVVIVLALAAFIFTIVFFAVPQLQRSLRNNQRERDLASLVAEVANYRAAHEGNLPTNGAARTWLQNTMGSEFKDTEGLTYLIHIRSNNSNYYGTHASGSTWGGHDIIIIQPDARCASGDDGVEPSTNSISVKLHTEDSHGIANSRKRFFCKTVER